MRPRCLSGLRADAGGADGGEVAALRRLRKAAYRRRAGKRRKGERPVRKPPPQGFRVGGAGDGIVERHVSDYHIRAQQPLPQRGVPGGRF